MPLAQQFLGQWPGAPFKPGVEILVRAVADAGVVDPNALAAAPAQQVVDRPAVVLAQNIPQRHIHGADRARLAAAVAEEIDRREHVVPVALDIERAAPDQQRREDIVDDGADGARHIEGFAETDQAFVGVDAQPHGIGLLVDPDRLKAGDFHPNLAVQKSDRVLHCKLLIANC